MGLSQHRRFVGKRYFFGFVLPEILIVMFLIGFIATIGISVYRGQIQKAYDARRKSDLHRLKLAAEEYEKDYDCYPGTLPSCTSSTNDLEDYIGEIPCDPELGYDYLYETDGLSCPRWFRIYTRLQNENDAQSKELGCNFGCGPGYWYTYYVSSPNAPEPQKGDASTTPTPQITVTATPSPTPTLTPTLTPSPTPGPTSTPSPTPSATPTSGAPVIIEVRVATSSDDAEERLSNGSVSLTSSDLELISDGSNPQEVGMRFNNLTIPQGASITYAYIEFETDETSSETTSVTFYAQDTDNAPTFTSSTNNITSRTKTSASVAWNNIPAWNTVSQKHQTPNLSPIIQEVINRVGWASGNDLVVIVTGSGRRVAESYNGESANAPLLHVEF